MAVPKVNLRRIKRKNSYVYMPDYNYQGKRHRETVGLNKKEAELLQSKIQSDLTLGKYKIPDEKV